MRKKNANKKQKQLIYRKDSPIPPPDLNRGSPWVMCMNKEKRKKLIYTITKWVAILTGVLTLVMMIGYSLGTVEEIRLIAILWILSAATTIFYGFLSLRISDK